MGYPEIIQHSLILEEFGTFTHQFPHSPNHMFLFVYLFTAQFSLPESPL